MVNEIEPCYWPIVNEAVMLLAVKTVKRDYKNKEPSVTNNDVTPISATYLTSRALLKISNGSFNPT